MKPIIRVENLSKQYRIGTAHKHHDTLRDALVSGVRNSLSRFRSGHGSQKMELIWALKDVSFEVQPGEIIGIIGRNGAGKSTLLKILSRITEPTTGNADLFGRVASLLEVGTGFHGELTGRENVLLNGAILGMKRTEIEEKFDEIVAFAEVEKFIDTPVKRYSSGMYLRLAFAVAAFLEPDILIVDEVLAVGDQSFRNKCLRKMEDVAHNGRTVLFVSHDITAISHLCTAAILLSQGKIISQGAVDGVVSEYRTSLLRTSTADLLSRTDRKGEGGIRLSGIRIFNSTGALTDTILSGENIEIVLDYVAEREFPQLEFAMAFYSMAGAPLIHFSMSQSSGPIFVRRGPGSVSCRIRKLPLAHGRYTINAAAQMGRLYDWVECASVVNVETVNFYGNGYKVSEGYCPFLVDSEWTS
ncbi:MAG: ABC transporter ATP-binding protein [Acidobacteria bacterium]|nr:ABC transporter ATP-binding protein [Acidobacteriota bacterium]MCW5970284.1 ABC transporter ATP-binding protein [Blastocatellales bacterium]